MKRDTLRNGTFELERDATLRLRAGDGVAIRALRGTVLVTREGDRDDHVLEPGDELRVDGRGLVVAWALAPSSLAIAPLPALRAPARVAQAA